MRIELFKHNEIAYQSAMEMLETMGKAAVIHPTGTGKSFIAFKLCAEHLSERVCWLSPSEYIFQTQVENLKSVTDGYAPENITFFTYAKLMLMSESEISEIQPDYIILDEFHRCGAEMWGKGVERLLESFPQVPILGLSATAIRYLDNQRDMADELFDGNIASEMTLGEAIVRQILNPPKYVLSVYSYQKELEKYQSRIRKAKSRSVQDAAEKYLEALRRALEKADGLDKIFERHMQDKYGKYIVFCANAEHMRDMIEKVPKWFYRVDSEPRIYKAYSNDPGTDEAFAAFKADSSEHLKLLFCIDMLNEGVHVEDISGVILFRPTVSPIIYKQQIGRALSASKTKDAVIFDIVNNIENLYSIGVIEEEMRVAMTYYRSRGEGEEIVTENFEIIDEVRECRELFEKLNETLTASWELMYECAKKYYEENGHLCPTRRYETEEGYSLGNWIYTQRKVRSGEQYGVLGEDRIARLDAIGMVWDGMRDQSWRRYYASAEEYYKEHGDLDVKSVYVTEDGLALGRWINNLRTYRKSGIQTSYLTAERIAELDKLGMIWNAPDYHWQQNYLAAMEYYQKHGDLMIPLGYETEKGIKLGLWIQNMRTAKNAEKGYRLTEEKLRQLEEIGMVWTSRSERQWEKGYEQAKKYYAQKGTLQVSSTYIDEDGFALGRWVRRHTEKRKDGSSMIKLTEERKEKLEALGIEWEKKDPWDKRFEYVKAYYAEHGDLNIPARYIIDGIWLGKWLYEQKQMYFGKKKGKKLKEERAQKLKELLERAEELQLIGE